MNNNNDVKLPYSFRLSETEVKAFQNAYPTCLPRFLNNAIYLASRDKALFDRIFFLITN